MELTITDQNFDSEVLKSTVPVLVDFWAPWCGPCRQMLPIVEELAKELEGKNVKVGKLNVDENQQIAGQFSVMSIPTFMVFKDGQAVETFTGGAQKEKLKELLEKHI